MILVSKIQREIDELVRSHEKAITIHEALVLFYINNEN
jgi:phage-related holin